VCLNALQGHAARLPEPAGPSVIFLRRTLRALGWGLSIVLIAAFLVGYAAPYLSPTSFWWTDLFAVGVPALSVLIGPLSLLMCGWGWYHRTRGRLLLGIGLLVLLLLRFGPRLVAWTASDSEPTALRIMTFNVPRAFAQTNSGTAMARFVRDEAPGVLAFQETQLHTTRHTPVALRRVSPTIQGILDDSIGYELPFLPHSTTLQQPVLGRIPLDSMSVHPLPPDGKQNARSRYTRTTFTWRGRSAVLYNVHLHSVGEARPWTLLPEEWTSWSRWNTFLRTYREGALRRAQQARLLRRRIARESRPVLIVGDFNSTPHQWAYQHLAEGLQNAVLRRVRGWGATFPAQRPLVQIDHILAGPAWQITAAHIPPPMPQSPLSDHRPVVAHLQWK